MNKVCCSRCGRVFEVFFINEKEITCVCGGTGKNPYYKKETEKPIIFFRIQK